MKEIFQSSGAAKATISEIEAYTQKANTILETLKLSEEKKEQLRAFGTWLMERTV